MIPLMKSTFLNEHETKRALAEFILTAPRLSMDVKCAEFERVFAVFQNRRHAILFNSGGSANLAILQALKNMGLLKTGDRVGFSALTWSTNTMPILQMGLEAVPVDCEPTTLNVMSQNLLQRLETTSLRAMFITNALGLSGDLARIRDICRERDVLLLEDNCESLGTELMEGRTGTFGLAASFSFFVAHHLSTIEGGMLCTDDDDVAEMLRIVRANGWDRNLSAKEQARWRARYQIRSEFEAKYTFYDLGFNLRPTEITGFLGLVQLGYLNDNIKKRAHNHERLAAVARKNSNLIPLNHAHIKTLSGFAFPVVCRSPQLREQYMREFSGAGIEIRPMIAGNIQRQPFYQKYVHRLHELPGADLLHHQSFYCGNYPELNEMELETITSCLLAK